MENLLDDKNHNAVQVIGPAGAPNVVYVNTTGGNHVTLQPNSAYLMIGTVDFMYALIDGDTYAIAAGNSTPWPEGLPRTFKTGSTILDLHLRARTEAGYVAIELQE